MSPAPPTPSIEQLQQLKQVRRAALLRKWTGGSKLTPDEMSEISDILPPEVLAVPPLPKPGYRKGYDHYAGVLGYDVRNIKRFVGIGKKARKHCPLDDPAALPAWWEEMKALGYLKQQVPQRLIDVALKHNPPAGGPAGSGAAAGEEEKTLPGEKSSTDKDQRGTKVDFTGIKGFGLEAAVLELRIQLSANQQALRKAMEVGENDVIVGKRKKHFEETLDLLRKTEDSLQKLQAARGDLMPVADFRSDLTTIMTTLRGMKRKLADNVCTVLTSALTPEQLGLVRKAIDDEGQREETLLRTAKHWKRNPDGSVSTAV